MRRWEKIGVAFACMLALLITSMPVCAERAEASSISGMPEITNLSSDFIRGVDISSVLALEESGVTYKTYGGTTEDIFEILAGAGVNYVRLRIWNNPYDSTSPYKGYGAEIVRYIQQKYWGKERRMRG